MGCIFSKTNDVSGWYDSECVTIEKNLVADQEMECINSLYKKDLDEDDNFEYNDVFIN